MRIGELAALVGVSTRTVRHYHYLGLLPEPERLPNGYREYLLRDAVALARVRRLSELGLSLDEIRGVLADDRGRELREVLTELDADATVSEDEQGTIRVDGDVLIVSAIAQTNLVVELAEPLRVVRSLGRIAHVRTIRFFADDPKAALTAWSTQRATGPAPAASVNPAAAPNAPTAGGRDQGRTPGS